MLHGQHGGKDGPIGPTHHRHRIAVDQAFFYEVINTVEDIRQFVFVVMPFDRLHKRLPVVAGAVVIGHEDKGPPLGDQVGVIGPALGPLVGIDARRPAMDGHHERIALARFVVVGIVENAGNFIVQGTGPGDDLGLGLGFFVEMCVQLDQGAGLAQFDRFLFAHQSTDPVLGGGGGGRIGKSQLAAILTHGQRREVLVVRTGFEPASGPAVAIFLIKGYFVGGAVGEGDQGIVAEGFELVAEAQLPVEGHRLRGHVLQRKKMQQADARALPFGVGGLLGGEVETAVVLGPGKAPGGLVAFGQNALGLAGAEVPEVMGRGGFTVGAVMRGAGMARDQPLAIGRGSHAAHGKAALGKAAALLGLEVVGKDPLGLEVDLRGVFDDDDVVFFFLGLLLDQVGALFGHKKEGMGVEAGQVGEGGLEGVHHKGRSTVEADAPEDFAFAAGGKEEQGVTGGAKDRVAVALVAAGKRYHEVAGVPRLIEAGEVEVGDEAVLFRGRAALGPSDGLAAGGEGRVASPGLLDDVFDRPFDVLRSQGKSQAAHK